MPLYTVNRAATALSTSNDLITVVASATKPLRIVMAKAGGAGNSSVFNELVMQRSSAPGGGSTGGGAITPEKVDPSSSAASFSVFTSWSGAQPPLTGGPLHRFTVNANGGIDPFVAVPGGEIAVPAGGQVSFRSVEGTSRAVLNLMIDEIN